MLDDLTRKLYSLFRECTRKRILDIYPSNEPKPKGHVLVSYRAEPLCWEADSRHFLSHSNAWESTEIVRIFNRLGYAVDAISWDDARFVSQRNYAAVFDIHRNLLRYDGDGTRKIFHVTGSNPAFSNRAEAERIRGVKLRRGVELSPRRFIDAQGVELFEKGLALADTVSLIGNDVTASTFPGTMRHKMTLIPATGSFLAGTRTSFDFLGAREFLWFNGIGAVHKGLDLVLEVFSRHPDLVLHVVGPYRRELDFVRAYRNELSKCPNVIGHGFVYPSGKKFHDIVKNVVAFVNPSCSEGMSTSAITCMQYGMIPIVSDHSGITLSGDMGVLLKSCSLDEIEGAVMAVCEKSAAEIKETMSVAQQFALHSFSREEFSRRMESLISHVLLPV